MDVSDTQMTPGSEQYGKMRIDEFRKPRRGRSPHRIRFRADT